MMDRALGAISTGSTAADNDIEAVNRFGMHYQWGRKDPFTPVTYTGYLAHNNVQEVQIYTEDGTAITKGNNGIGATVDQFKYDDKTTTTIEDLIQNPSTFYAQGDGANYVPIASTGFDTGTKKGDWWNPSTKTIYDPCPNGYRIPKSGTYGTGGEVTTHPDWSAWLESGLKSGRIFKSTSFVPASGYRTYSNGKFYGVDTSGCNWMSTPLNSVFSHYQSFKFSYVNLTSAYHRSYSFPTRCIKE